jgi:putative flippase GtrA
VLALNVNSIRTFLLSQQGRYLMIGGVNTGLAYLISITTYYWLKPFLHLIFIALIINVICITVSFFSQKLFVFRTKGNWIAEYLRCYVVYAGAMVLGIVGLWALVDLLHIPFWIAQGSLMFISIAFSYFGHKKYTFKAGNGTNG